MQIKEEELTIYNVESLHKDLLDALKSGDLAIDMQNVKKIDMSVIQLFASAKKSCTRDRKSFTLQHVNEDVMKTLQNCACEFLVGDQNG